MSDDYRESQLVDQYQGILYISLGTEKKKGSSLPVVARLQ